MNGEGRPGQGAPHSRSSDEDNHPGSYPRYVGTNYGRAALESEGARVEVAPNGHRHKVLLQAAYRMGQLVAGRELYDRDRIEGVLVDAGLTIGLPRSDVLRTVSRGIDHGLRRPRKAPVDGQMLRDQNEARLAIIDTMAVAAAHPWRGRADVARYRTLVAFHLIALGRGLLRLNVDSRTLGEAAGVSHQTALNHMAALEGPWVRRVRRGSWAPPTPGARHGTATTWQVVRRFDIGKPSSPGPEVCQTTGLHSEVPSANIPLLRPDHPFWSGHPYAYRIYLALVGEEVAVSAAALRDHTGAAKSTVHVNLNRLLDAGLVERSGDGWTALDPEQVEPPEVADITVSRRRRHRDDREHHARFIGFVAGRKASAS